MHKRITSLDFCGGMNLSLGFSLPTVAIACMGLDCLSLWIHLLGGEKKILNASSFY